MKQSDRHHQIDYVELSATDLAAAKSFYSEAFGWEFNDYGPGYAGVKGADGEIGGIEQTATAQPVGGPFVILFSDDLDASAAAIEAAGGTITVPAYDFPGGRRLHFTDPSGNELGVWAQ